MLKRAKERYERHLEGPNEMRRKSSITVEDSQQITRVDLNRYLELKLRMFHKQHNVATISHGLLQATDNFSRDRSAT